MELDGHNLFKDVGPLNWRFQRIFAVGLGRLLLVANAYANNLACHSTINQAHLPYVGLAHFSDGLVRQPINVGRFSAPTCRWIQKSSIPIGCRHLTFGDCLLLRPCLRRFLHLLTPRRCLCHRRLLRFPSTLLYRLTPRLCLRLYSPSPCLYHLLASRFCLWHWVCPFLLGRWPYCLRSSFQIRQITLPSQLEIPSYYVWGGLNLIMWIGLPAFIIWSSNSLISS